MSWLCRKIKGYFPNKRTSQQLCDTMPQNTISRFVATTTTTTTAADSSPIKHQKTLYNKGSYKSRRDTYKLCSGKANQHARNITFLLLLLRGKKHNFVLTGIRRVSYFFPNVNKSKLRARQPARQPAQLGCSSPLGQNGLLLFTACSPSATEICCWFWRQ